MARLPYFLLRWLRHLKKFYTGTFVVWLFWILFVDDNKLSVVLENRRKMIELERDLNYYKEQVRRVRQERKEVFGNDAMLEKWAREKYLMRKPTEDVYVILDENGESIEKRE